MKAAAERRLQRHVRFPPAPSASARHGEVMTALADKKLSPITDELVFSAVPARFLDEVRASRLDDAGRQPWRVTDDEGGSPLRCCLRYSRPGEDLLLLS